jgi:hypothetical protein
MLMFIKINISFLFLNVFDGLLYFSSAILNMLLLAAHFRFTYSFLFGNPELKFRTKILNQIRGVFNMACIV